MLRLCSIGIVIVLVAASTAMTSVRASKNSDDITGTLARMRQWQVSHERDQDRLNAAVEKMSTVVDQNCNRLTRLETILESQIWWMRTIAGALIVQLLLAGWEIVKRLGRIRR
jgi:uncharacterized protein YlxW (UPF0749 family)